MTEPKPRGWLSGLADRRTALAALVAAPTGGPGTRAAAGWARCIGDGRPCDRDAGRGRNGRCCSDRCRGPRGRKRCAPARGARGCTVDLNACPADAADAPCPGFPAGFCVVDRARRPFCANGLECLACATNADCDDAFGTTGSRCVACPRFCDAATNGRACVFFSTV